MLDGSKSMQGVKTDEVRSSFKKAIDWMCQQKGQDKTRVSMIWFNHSAKVLANT